MVIKLPIHYLSEYELVKQDVRYLFGSCSHLAYYVLFNISDFDAFIFDVRQSLECDEQIDFQQYDKVVRGFFYSPQFMTFIDRFWETHSELYRVLLPKTLLNQNHQFDLLMPYMDNCIFIQATPI